jgi:outer membrane protein OmpA-like peptidoglycan-associated protein
MKKRLAAGFSLIFALGLASCASKPEPAPEPAPTPPPPVDLKMAIQVISEPPKADVSYHGKVVGETPAAIDITTFGDLEAIVATKQDLDLVEKRIRILSPESAQLIFKLGKGQQSAVAKSLKLEHILIFDYSEKVAFDSDRFDLKLDALPILNKQADILNNYFPNASIHVCGYTDATGSEDHNLKLSLKRADAVSSYLIARGVSKDRLKTHGFGKEYPVDTNTTPAGRMLNRRTEVILPQ